MSYEQFLRDLGELFVQLKETLIAFVPNLTVAVIVFLIGLLLARLFHALMNRLIKHPERIIPNKRIQNKIKHLRLESSARLISKIVYWIIIFFFLTASTEILGLPIITTWLSGIMQYLPNILVAVVIVFTGIISGSLLRDLISTARLVYATIIGRIVQYSILSIAILIAINQVGIDIGLLSGLLSIVLAAVLFSAALAFGLGARTSVSNILAAYYLQNRYREGQSIKIGDVEGQIIQITTTAVIVEAADGQVSVPAHEFSVINSTLLRKEE